MSNRVILTKRDYPTSIDDGINPPYLEHHEVVYSTELDSEGHQGWWKPSPGSDCGGPFALTKRTVITSDLEVTLPFGSAGGHFTIPVLPRDIPMNNSDFPSIDWSSDDSLFARGGTAISRMAPTRSRAALSTFLAELHEGLPHAAGLARTGRARAVASGYLGYEFGWKPLLNDVRKFVNNTQRAEELWKRYERHSGQYEHISLNLFDRQDVTSDGPVPGNRAWPEPPGIGAFGGDWTSTTIRKEKSWAEGVFAYWVPDPGLGRDFDRADYLYGISITPDTVWELTPWSWAADWVVNVGDVLKNVANFAKDGLVMPYAYLMEEVSAKRVSTLQNIYNSGTGSARYGSSSMTATIKHCRRVKASPFGFGIDWDGFSDRQLAIAAALGISRRGH